MSGNGRLVVPLLVRGDARQLPLPDESVDLILTSPPYFGLRSYTDGGEHYATQIGSEATPQEFLDALIECTREMVRVLKQSGSIWINLGDSYYSGKGAPGRTTVDQKSAGRTARRFQLSPLDASGLGFPQKSLMLLPHRYAIRCVDELGLILRQDQVWEKPNGLPESVVDRTRRSHEYLFHLVRSPRYYSAVDEIREPHTDTSDHAAGRRARLDSRLDLVNGGRSSTANPLGKLPGSVWEIASQPLNVPDRVSHARCCDGRKRDGCEDGLDHYAAFPMELARRVVRGWSPREVCTACGEGRRPTVHKELVGVWHDKQPQRSHHAGRKAEHGHNYYGVKETFGSTAATITGYACACPDTTAPSTPGVCVDPFGGTGTTSLVAAMHGRQGISVDRSWDYCDGLARWRVNDPKERARAAGLDAAVVARVPVMAPSQVSLFDGTPS